MSSCLFFLFSQSVCDLKSQGSECSGHVNFVRCIRALTARSIAAILPMYATLAVYPVRQKLIVVSVTITIPIHSVIHALVRFHSPYRFAL